MRRLSASEAARLTVRASSAPSSSSCRSSSAFFVARSWAGVGGTAGVPPAVPPTPAQERATKKAELERQLEELGAEEARTVNRAASDAERRRIQNMFANRREQLMEELEDIL